LIGYVLKIENELVGLSLGAKKPCLKGMEYFIDQFCISEKFQGQGVGSKFLELIESDIKKSRYKNFRVNYFQRIPIGEILY